MMKRRWSNNGGFSLRILEESSSEVTSSSALGMSPAVAMSPTSIGSAEYNDMDVWGYEDSAYTTATPSIIASPSVIGCNNTTTSSTTTNVNTVNTIHATIHQAFAASLPRMQINGSNGIGVRSTSINSISPGNTKISTSNFFYLSN